jgi:hypothetical protein
MTSDVMGLMRDVMTMTSFVAGRFAG